MHSIQLFTWNFHFHRKTELFECSFHIYGDSESVESVRVSRNTKRIMQNMNKMEFQNRNVHFLRYSNIPILVRRNSILNHSFHKEIIKFLLQPRLVHTTLKSRSNILNRKQTYQPLTWSWSIVDQLFTSKLIDVQFCPHQMNYLLIYRSHKLQY